MDLEVEVGICQAGLSDHRPVSIFKIWPCCRASLSTSSRSNRHHGSSSNAEGLSGGMVAAVLLPATTAATTTLMVCYLSSYGGCLLVLSCLVLSCLVVSCLVLFASMRHRRATSREARIVGGIGGWGSLDAPSPGLAGKLASWEVIPCLP